MEHKVDIHQALRVFDKLTRYGTKKGEDYHLQGLKGRPNFDGYTVVMSDEQTTLSIHFHNAYNLDFPNSIALEQFLERLQMIDKASFDKKD